MYLLAALLPHIIVALDLKHGIAALLAAASPLMNELHLVFLVFIHHCLWIIFFIPFLVAVFVIA